MATKPSPGPWKIQDNESRSYKVVAADGTVVCYIHYPKSMTDGANIRLVERAWTLFERFKNMKSIIETYLRLNREDPKKDPTCIANDELLAELEIRDQVKKPPSVGG